LGLPLARRLAELLGGTLTLTSEPGIGSTFAVTLPTRYVPPEKGAAPLEWTTEPGKLPLLVIEDAPDVQYFYEKILKNSPFHVCPASSVEDAVRALETMHPAAIVLDLVLAGTAEWDFLIRLKRDERTREIPVVVVSALEEREKGLALGADAYLVKPIKRRTLIETLTGLHAEGPAALRVLTIDDEEAARYIVRQCLPGPLFDVSEASSGAEGLSRARADRPDVILLDLIMPDMTGRETLEQLLADPVTRDIPVVIATGAALVDDEKRALLRHASAVVLKENLSRHTLQDVVRTALGRTV
jgi:CheY-like chemotaxis protein